VLGDMTNPDNTSPKQSTIEIIPRDNFIFLSSLLEILEFDRMREMLLPVAKAGGKSGHTGITKDKNHQIFLPF
jgi:hypothetical protein